MKSFCCSFIIFSVLFMGVDSAADIAIKGHPHDDGATHQLDANNSATPNQSAETDNDHCERCCHGHSANTNVAIASLAAPIFGRDYIFGRTSHVRNLAQAPPTPPPNA